MKKLRQGDLESEIENHKVIQSQELNDEKQFS